MSGVEAWLTAGDQCMELAVNFKNDLLRKTPGLMRNIFFEYIREFDVTLLYIHGRGSESEFVYVAYDRDWIDDVFMPLKPTGYPALLHPMSYRIFYSHNGVAVLPLLKKLGREVAWFRSEKTLPGGAEPVLYQISRRFCKDFPAEKLINRSLAQVVEVFQNLSVPGDYIDLNRKKYEVRVRDNVSYGITCGSTVGFNILEEIKRFFREKGWSAVASGDYTPWDDFDLDPDSKRSVDDLTIPYLLVTDTVVRA